MLSGRYVVQQLETNLRSIENAFKTIYVHLIAVCKSAKAPDIHCEAYCIKINKPEMSTTTYLIVSISYGCSVNKIRSAKLAEDTLCNLSRLANCNE